MNHPKYSKTSSTKLLTETSKKRNNVTLKQVPHSRLNLDLYKVWKAKPNEDQKLISSVRRSEIFSPDRVETFVKFNFRIVQNKNLDYESTFRKVLELRSSKDGKTNRGTMHVSDLWCENNMQELLGHLPYPKDRVKVLKQYQKKKDLRIKTLNR